MIEDTSGFYKYESGQLHYGPNYVRCLEYKLFKETKDDHTYPVDGWHWFDSVELARKFFEIPAPVEVEEEEEKLAE